MMPKVRTHRSTHPAFFAANRSLRSREWQSRRQDTTMSIKPAPQSPGMRVIETQKLLTRCAKRQTTHVARSCPRGPTCARRPRKPVAPVSPLGSHRTRTLATCDSPPPPSLDQSTVAWTPLPRSWPPSDGTTREGTRRWSVASTLPPRTDERASRRGQTKEGSCRWGSWCCARRPFAASAGTSLSGLGRLDCRSVVESESAGKGHIWNSRTLRVSAPALTYSCHSLRDLCRASVGRTDPIS